MRLPLLCISNTNNLGCSRSSSEKILSVARIIKLRRRFGDDDTMIAN